MSYVCVRACVFDEVNSAFEQSQQRFNIFFCRGLHNLQADRFLQQRQQIKCGDPRKQDLLISCVPLILLGALTPRFGGL